MMEKWDDRKDFCFPSCCFVEGVEKKWSDGKIFYLVEIKKKKDTIKKCKLHKFTLMSLVNNLIYIYIYISLIRKKKKKLKLR